MSNPTRHARGRLALLTFVLLLAGGTLLHHSPARAADGLIVATPVPGPVDAVLSRIKKSVAKGGMMIMGELHQGKVLAMTGLKVQSESVFVGNPQMGKKLFGAQPGAGQVVPVRINVYAGKDGRTVVSYIPPSRLLAGFHDPMLDEMAVMLDRKLAGLVGMLAQ